MNTEECARRTLALIGAPTSAGAYAPGQEKAPAALRRSGLVQFLESSGWAVHDAGDIQRFRWRVDRENPTAMNAEAAAAIARDISKRVAHELRTASKVVVLGGDCSIELGTVAGVRQAHENIGLIYIDLDTDLNTPKSTKDGALDWMGVAHLLDLPDTVDELCACGSCRPLLEPHQIAYFGADNIEPFEMSQIERMRLNMVRLAQVKDDPARSARQLLTTWGESFDGLLVHLDLDVLDYVDIQLAENNRRNWGLTFDQLMAALEVFLRAPQLVALTICELNPDHGPEDGSAVRMFAEGLARAMTAPV